MIISGKTTHAETHQITPQIYIIIECEQDGNTEWNGAVYIAHDDSEQGFTRMQLYTFSKPANWMLQPVIESARARVSHKFEQISESVNKSMIESD